MAFDFPASPTIGQQYPVSPGVGQPAYRWNGSVWTTFGAWQPSTKVPVYTDGTNAMAAQLTLVGNPVAANDAARKAYVDTAVSGVSTVVRGYLSGLTLSASGASTTFSIAAGLACDSTFVDMMLLAASLNKTTGSWAVGTGNGALDTGAIAATTWYHVFLIKRPDTQVVDVLVSLSATAPTLPTNYTRFRRIGSMRTTAGSVWLGFIQTGNEFLFNQMAQDATGINNPGITAILRTLTVPLGVKVKALLAVMVQTNTTSQFCTLYLSDPALPDLAANATTLFSTEVYSGSASFNAIIASQLFCWTNLSSQIRTRLLYSDAGINYNINTLGWMDQLGRDS